LIYMNIKETIREIINTFTLVQWWWYNNDNTTNINYYQIMGMKRVLILELLIDSDIPWGFCI
jgi:hypothetical protein